jgi:hypothetical protein
MMNPKLVIASLLLILIGQTAMAQYYYKDIIVTQQTADRWRLFKINKVRNVRLNSFENDGQPSEGFDCTQEVSGDYSLITTHTKTNRNADSWLMTWYSPTGLPAKTVDTSDTYRSVSEYQYDISGRLLSIDNVSIETDNHVQAEERHVWQYDAHTNPSGMLKIRNGTDTTIVHFIRDEKGNIIEEHALHNREALPTVYYYYDGDSRLTDIVRYDLKAQRLLPDYVFEYDAAGKTSSMLMVPERGSAEYQKWLYEYDDKGLKTKESCFNRHKELMGMIQYAYK